MTFKNIFTGGGSSAKSAEETAHDVHARIPGVRPEHEGVDPELYEGIPEVARDPKIVRETSPEALAVMNSFVAPLFKSAQTAAAQQQEASTDPRSTSGMASGARDEAVSKVAVEIRDEDRPKVSDKQREESAKGNYRSAKNAQDASGGWDPDSPATS